MLCFAQNPYLKLPLAGIKDINFLTSIEGRGTIIVGESGRKWGQLSTWGTRMFYGEYEHNIDKKGRLIIPARFREVVRDKFVDTFMVTTGYEKCLFVFPPDQWQVFEQTLKDHSPHQRDPRAVSRVLYSGTNQCICDKQGRVNLPQKLLDYAGIKKEVVIIGVSTRFEIWDREEWNKYKQEIIENGGLEKRAENMDVKME